MLSRVDGQKVADKFSDEWLNRIDDPQPYVLRGNCAEFTGGKPCRRRRYLLRPLHQGYRLIQLDPHTERVLTRCLFICADRHVEQRFGDCLRSFCLRKDSYPLGAKNEFDCCTDRFLRQAVHLSVWFDVFDDDFYSLEPPQRFPLLIPRLSKAWIQAAQGHEHRHHSRSHHPSTIEAISTGCGQSLIQGTLSPDSCSSCSMTCSNRL